jgi:hypothetical protein
MTRFVIVMVSSIAVTAAPEGFQQAEMHTVLQREPVGVAAGNQNPDCPSTPPDKIALNAVDRAVQGVKGQRVYGLVNPRAQHTFRADGWWTRPNPRGEGVVVVAWKEHENRAYYIRERLGVALS